jgi:hypothetical protein
MSDQFCALCQSDLGEDEPVSRCPECGAAYHRDCHAENGGCGNYGCSLVPAPAAQGVATAPTVWGRETKRCPGCDREIRAAAVRCRHCGASFGSVESISPEAFQQQAERDGKVAHLRRWAAAGFLAGAIPCVSPFVLVIGIPLTLSNRALIRRLPPLYRFLGAAGFGLAFLWVLIGIAVLALSGGR